MDTTQTHRRRFALLVAISLLGGLLSGSPAAGAYTWPLKPFDQQHPVRGFFGDPRTPHDAHGAHSFHTGIDISAPDGTPVYAVATGTANVNASRVAVQSGRTIFAYWHVDADVRTGQWVIAHRTVVGHVRAPWGHVHLSELFDRRFVNPLRPGGIAPYVDVTHPVVRDLQVERGDRPVSPIGLHGAVSLVVEAYDTTPVAVPAPWSGKPVTPCVLMWRLRGAATTPWKTAWDVRSTIPTNAFFGSFYGRWTRQNHPWKAGRYRFRLGRALDTATLPDGRYLVEVRAIDSARNGGLSRFPITVGATA